MLITEYFQQIDSVISDCIYVVETNVIKDKRSLHIGVIEGQLLFTDDSVLHFIEFVNVKETTELYKYSYHYQDTYEGIKSWSNTQFHHFVRLF